MEPMKRKKLSWSFEAQFLKQRNTETNKRTKNIFTNFDKMLLVKFILHPDFMALSLDCIARHAFSIAHPQSSKFNAKEFVFRTNESNICLLDTTHP